MECLHRITVKKQLPHMPQLVNVMPRQLQVIMLLAMPLTDAMCHSSLRQDWRLLLQTFKQHIPHF